MEPRRASSSAFLSPGEQSRVEEAIAAAERETSGEIRVVISGKAMGDPLAEARRLFVSLGMPRTAARNGVLVLLAVRERRFAILGDEGIHRLVGQEGWEGFRDAMEARFRAGDMVGGLELAIREVAAILRTHFPRRGDDVNELPDGVVHQ
jgi:uncharacterized membrane protein